MTSESPTPKPLPTVIDAKVYGSPGHVHIDSIYASGYGDMLYLYDPENPPHEVETEQVSTGTLSLSTAQAADLYAKLGDFLGRQK